MSLGEAEITVKGPKGELIKKLPKDITVRQEDGTIYVERPSDIGQHRALHGLTRSIVANMVIGVSEGYKKELEIIGVGYRAAMKGPDMEVQAGYSHPVMVKAVSGITLETPAPTRVIVSGADKELVGEVAAKIRAIRRPEPYKGKGIRYLGEYVKRKVGKTAK